MRFARTLVKRIPPNRNRWNYGATNCSREQSRISNFASPAPTLPNFQTLLVVRRCVRERIIEATTIPLRRVHKSVEIFLDIDRFEEQAFVTNLVRVFDQNSSGAIDAPDPKSRPQESAVRIKDVRPRHRMQTTDRDSILAIKGVIGSITDSSFVEQLLPF